LLSGSNTQSSTTKVRCLFFNVQVEINKEWTVREQSPLQIRNDPILSFDRILTSLSEGADTSVSNTLVDSTQVSQFKKDIINMSRHIEFVSESSLTDSSLVNDERCPPNRR